MANQKLAYTFEEAAEQCSYSVRTLKQAIANGNLTARYVNTEGVIRHEDLAAWIGQLPTMPDADPSQAEEKVRSKLSPAKKDPKPTPSQPAKPPQSPLTDTEGELMTPEELAKKLQVSPGTVANWRNQRKGPEFVRIGGVVRYSPDAVKAWVQKQPTD